MPMTNGDAGQRATAYHGASTLEELFRRATPEQRGSDRELFRMHSRATQEMARAAGAPLEPVIEFLPPGDPRRRPHDHEAIPVFASGYQGQTAEAHTCATPRDEGQALGRQESTARAGARGARASNKREGAPDGGDGGGARARLTG